MNKPTAEQIYNSTEEPVKYNPQANYKWNNDDVFTLTGIQFQEVLNGVKLLYESELKPNTIPEITKHVALHSALVHIESAFINAIKTGVVTEIISSPPPASRAE